MKPDRTGIRSDNKTRTVYRSQHLFTRGGRGTCARGDGCARSGSRELVSSTVEASGAGGGQGAGPAGVLDVCAC